jgi:hypothetical protein
MNTLSRITITSTALILIVTAISLVPTINAQVGTKKTASSAQKQSSGTLNAAKFKDVQRAATSVKVAVSVGVSYRDFPQLLQKFQTEVELLSKPKNTKETNLLDLYSSSLGLYKASYDVWGETIKDASDHDWLPKGGVLVEPDLETTTLVLAKKYNIPVRPIPSYAPDFVKGGKWAYVDGDALMQRIWADASDLVDKANARLD